jgi:predicted ATPase
VLDYIQLRNFKAAREVTATLASLTVLAGLNGSGKSTLLQILSALRQSYNGSLPSGLALSGALVQLGQGGDVLSEGAQDDLIHISVQESGVRYHWACLCIEDANQLRFEEWPGKLPQFLTSQDFQYLQADRIVPKTLYPQASQHARDSGFLGAHGEYTADFVALRQSLRSAKESSISFG